MGLEAEAYPSESLGSGPSSFVIGPDDTNLEQFADFWTNGRCAEAGALACVGIVRIGDR